MKERRRTKRNRSGPKEAATIKKEEKQKKPAVGSDLVEVPAGEDKKSFVRHNIALETVHAKLTSSLSKNKKLSSQGVAKVEQLMEITYAMRRNDVLQDGHSFSVAKKYPFLQYYEHVRKQKKFTV